MNQSICLAFYESINLVYIYESINLVYIYESTNLSSFLDDYEVVHGECQWFLLYHVVFIELVEVSWKNTEQTTPLLPLDFV